MSPATLKRLIHTLGVLLFLASCALFFFLPGDAPASCAKQERTHSPIPWVLWIGLMAGSMTAFASANRLEQRETRA